MADPDKKNKDKYSEDNACFVIMPISDPEGYEPGHFQHVYDNVIRPSVIASGFIPHRADEVQQTNFIHLDILKKLIEAPIAICDLSSRNPNVLFELGIRQAFDKPVVLIQEKGTPKIFDISPLRIYDYSKDMKYHEVINSQQQLVEIIKSTMLSTNDSGNINSIVRLMALSSPASIPKLDGERKENLAFEVIQSQISELTKIVQRNNIAKDSIEDTTFFSNNSRTIDERNVMNNLFDSYHTITSNDKISNSEKKLRLKELAARIKQLNIRGNNSIDSYNKHLILSRINEELNNIN